MNDDGAPFFITWFFVTMVLVINTCFSSCDDKIINKSKIKIGNAVYQCQKLQELDLK